MFKAMNIIACVENLKNASANQQSKVAGIKFQQESFKNLRKRAQNKTSSDSKESFTDHVI